MFGIRVVVITPSNNTLKLWYSKKAITSFLTIVKNEMGRNRIIFAKSHSRTSPNWELKELLWPPPPLPSYPFDISSELSGDEQPQQNILFNSIGSLSIFI